MGRKRSRKYSSDFSESDSEGFVYESDSEIPPKKKYSLRDRKGRNFINNFKNDIIDQEEEEEEEKNDSFESSEEYDLDPNDEEFDLDSKDEEFVTSVPNLPTLCKTTVSEPESGGLIDFEDIIRADIVINQNKIDYDEKISKNEIKGRKKTEHQARKKLKGKRVTAKLDKDGPSDQLDSDEQPLVEIIKPVIDEKILEEEKVL